MDKTSSEEGPTGQKNSGIDTETIEEGARVLADGGEAIAPLPREQFRILGALTYGADGVHAIQRFLAHREAPLEADTLRETLTELGRAGYITTDSIGDADYELTERGTEAVCETLWWYTEHVAELTLVDSETYSETRARLQDCEGSRAGVEAAGGEEA